MAKNVAKHGQSHKRYLLENARMWLCFDHDVNNIILVAKENAIRQTNHI